MINSGFFWLYGDKVKFMRGLTKSCTGSERPRSWDELVSFSYVCSIFVGGTGGFRGARGIQPGLWLSAD